MKRLRVFVYLWAALLLVACTIGPWTLSQPAARPEWPTRAWQIGTPEEQGIDSAKLAEALLTMREQKINIHSLLLIRNGKVVVDAYFYPYDGAAVHDLASVTKSVMTTLIGIAVDQGKLDLDDTMVSFFPERSIANLDEAKAGITVRHLVSMSSGLECTEDRGSSTEMRASPDWVQYGLDRKMAAEPGSSFVYCNSAIHLLSPILQQATGLTALDFARQNLFEPLGIHDAMWERDPQGYYDGWGDLSLYPRDMAKLGFLFLQQGKWEDGRILSRQWVQEATSVQIASPEGDEAYGYGWWPSLEMEGAYQADGRGGQYIVVIPEWDMILVTTGGGFELDEIDELLLASFSDFERPLPANPEGVARLEAAMTAVAQPPAAAPVAPLSSVARAISGKTFVFEPNPAELDSIAFTFDGSVEATGYVVADGRPPMTVLVGLDGVYRFSTGLDGRPLALRGAWINEETFLFEYNSVASNDQMLLQFHFQGDQVTVDVRERAGMPGVHFTGHLQEP